ncbi:large subunit ribosomal protein L22 [Parelusimicrobium proximum]|uniref:50S ribosomal protein L22 n=1 Tax=Parelusimicrobium proximum TaxID=3228953 RepID=UPI003D16DE5F
MEAFAIAKFQRHGDRKISLVLEQIRGKNIKAAQEILPFIEKRTAELVYKTLNSAAANLEVKTGTKLDLSKVYVKEAFANQGPTRNLRRIQPGPQGRAMPYRKSMSHLTVVVSDEKKGGR